MKSASFKSLKWTLDTLPQSYIISASLICDLGKRSREAEDNQISFKGSKPWSFSRAQGHTHTLLCLCLEGWLFTLKLFSNVTPPAECALEDETYEDGAETQVECNSCVCACGNWVCTAMTCTGRSMQLGAGNLTRPWAGFPREGDGLSVFVHRCRQNTGRGWDNRWRRGADWGGVEPARGRAQQAPGASLQTTTQQMGWSKLDLFQIGIGGLRIMFFFYLLSWTSSIWWHNTTWFTEWSYQQTEDINAFHNIFFKKKKKKLLQDDTSYTKLHKEPRNWP